MHTILSKIVFIDWKLDRWWFNHYFARHLTWIARLFYLWLILWLSYKRPKQINHPSLSIIMAYLISMCAGIFITWCMQCMAKM